MANSRLLHLLSRFQDASPYGLGALFIDGGVYGRHSPSWRHRCKHTASLSAPTCPCALLHILLLVWLPSYPLAYANTTCCLVLATNNLLCRSLHHLSASPHHMLGGGDLDLLSGSPRSPPGNPPPLRLTSPNGIGGRWLELRCALRRCYSRLSPIGSDSMPCNFLDVVCRIPLNTKSLDSLNMKLKKAYSSSSKLVCTFHCLISWSRNREIFCFLDWE